MRSLAPLLFALTIVGAGNGMAAAQDIGGAWSFKTDIERKGCSITGNMSISAPDENQIRTCSFVSRETCDFDPEQSWQVDQTCRIVPQERAYIIRSKVVGSLTEGYSASGYLPDHFIVEPQSPTRMTGLWQDRNFSAPVVFWRDEALPVS